MPSEGHIEPESSQRMVAVFERLTIPHNCQTCSVENLRRFSKRSLKVGKIMALPRISDMNSNHWMTSLMIMVVGVHSFPRPVREQEVERVLNCGMI